MSAEIEKIFRDEVREKKTAARGVKAKTGKLGRVNHMRLPGDFAGREYKKAVDLDYYNLNEVLSIALFDPVLRKSFWAQIPSQIAFEDQIDNTITNLQQTLQHGLSSLLLELKQDMVALKPPSSEEP